MKINSTESHTQKLCNPRIDKPLTRHPVSLGATGLSGNPDERIDRLGMYLSLLSYEFHSSNSWDRQSASAMSSI